MLNPRQNTAKLQARARTMRKAPSDAERRLWNELRNRQLDGLKFRRQVPLGSYVADFACDECRLIVEVDGNQHEHAAEYDEQRTKGLNALGWRVIRISAGDVLRDVKQASFYVLAEARLASEAKPSP